MGKRIRMGAVALSLVAVMLSAPAEASAATVVPYDLNATVFVNGEQVHAVTLDTSRLGRVDPASLGTDMFSVHATSRSPLPPDSGQTVSNLYDTDREVTGVRVDASGKIVIELATDPNLLGGFATFGSASPAGRGVMLDLTYTITQHRPFALRNGRRVMGSFVQRDLVDAEVDAFTHGVGADGMKYRLFTPRRIKKNARHPLIIWLHGNGEGGMLGSSTNELPLRANRGALGLTTPQAQRIFGGAYVLAPQVPDTWYNHRESGYAAQVKARQRVRSRGRPRRLGGGRGRRGNVRRSTPTIGRLCPRCMRHSGTLVLIEVKSSRGVDPSSWRTMAKLKQQWGDRVGAAVVLHTAPQQMRLHDWLHVLPVWALWRHPA